MFSSGNEAAVIVSQCQCRLMDTAVSQQDADMEATETTTHQLARISTPLTAFYFWRNQRLSNHTYQLLFLPHDAT